MSRVFVVKEPVGRVINQETGERAPGLDLSPALEFGMLVYIFRAGARPSPDGALLMAGLRVFLDDFDYTQDWLIPVGDQVACCATAMVLAERGPLRLLKHDWRTERYRPVILMAAPIPDLNFDASLDDALNYAKDPLS